MNRRYSRPLAVGGLVVLALLLLQPASTVRLLAALPLALAALAGFHRSARWGLPVAILLLPYFSFGVMTALTDPAGRAGGVVVAALSVFVLLAAMDTARRG